RQGARRRGRGRRRGPGRAGAGAGEAEREFESGARALRAGGPVRVAARGAAGRAALRRGGARPGQADARPRGGGVRAEEVLRHEQGGGGGGGAGRTVPDVLLYGAGERSGFPGVPAAGIVAGEPARADFAGVWRGGGPPVSAARAGGAVFEGGIL